MKPTLTLFTALLLAPLAAQAQQTSPSATAVTLAKPADDLAKIVAASGMVNHLRLDLQRPIDPRLEKLETGDLAKRGLFRGKTHVVRTAGEVSRLSGKLAPGDQLVLAADGAWKDARFTFQGEGTEAAPILIRPEVEFQSPDRHGKPGAARVQGGAHIAVGNVESFAFKPTESFTIQAWFQTDVSGNQVIAARTGAYSLGVKDGKLSAWLMQDGGQFVEATGVTAATDAKWHHASAVFDRSAQTLTLYLDGKPDGVPQSIAGIGASSSPSPLTLGSFGGSFPFNGALDEIAIHRAALTPDKFATATDYAAHPPARLGAQTGRYTTTTCDWGQAVRLTKLRTTAALNDGTIIARVETSHDGFKTVAETRDVPVNSGDQATSINGLKPAPQARLVVTLATPTEATVSPVLKSLKLAGEPTP